MIVMQVQRPEVQVLSAHTPDGDPLKVLVLIDPATGIQIHASLPEHIAAQIGAALQRPSLAAASATAVAKVTASAKAQAAATPRRKR